MRPHEFQAPPRGTVNLDHVGYYVPRMDAAADMLERLGFTLTPFSAHVHRLASDAPLQSAGTGNRCVMFRTGYLEIVTPTGDTSMAEQLRIAMDRYVGLHLIAFGTAAPDLDHARLTEAGYAPLAPVALQREIDTPEGTDTVRFTVVRVPPGVMPEGRIQFCRQDTPQLIWQERWLDHRNQAEGLTGALLCVDDPRAVAERYGRFCGIPPRGMDGGWRIETARGALTIFDPAACRRTFGVPPPTLPWIAGPVLTTRSMEAARAGCAAAGVPMRDLAGDRLLIELPPQVGGLLVFEDGTRRPMALA